jgi:hypothetical protein
MDSPILLQALCQTPAAGSMGSTTCQICVTHLHGKLPALLAQAAAALKHLTQAAAVQLQDST